SRAIGAGAAAATIGCLATGTAGAPATTGARTAGISKVDAGPCAAAAGHAATEADDVAGARKHRGLACAAHAPRRPRTFCRTRRLHRTARAGGGDGHRPLRVHAAAAVDAGPRGPDA